MPVPGAGEVVRLPLFNGSCSLDRLSCNAKEHQMPWPQEGSRAALRQLEKISAQYAATIKIKVAKQPA